jgi:hypothetical protein
MNGCVGLPRRQTVGVPLLVGHRGRRVFRIGIRPEFLWEVTLCGSCKNGRFVETYRLC